MLINTYKPKTPEARFSEGCLKNTKTVFGLIVVTLL